ncbi:protein-L-isoaspartate O-methyltransferase [Beijerinckia sp. L45]|uniref:protein-L-isoaspartate O-methyltransferase family protein n=1 Tax=Beijerinckia sp. L45 TaxID=1641855 RepID=UPI00131A9EBD|nr:protein-L-isoaspartate O-methyltransferase [Beijerinckia sp. L45]
MRNSSTPDAPDLALDAAVAHARRDDALAIRAEAKAAFHLRMRARGIQDLAVLRAFELVPREFFVPHRYLDLATRDLPLPIDCGQTLLEPWLVGRMIEALGVDRSHRLLEIGAGTGYATAILASLARDVIGIERFQSLALAAQARLTDLAIMNAVIAWGDGLAVPPQVELFDRIIVHGLLDAPTPLVERLANGGVLVCARSVGEGGSQHVVRIEKTGDETSVETAICPCRLQPIVAGIAAAL